MQQLCPDLSGGSNVQSRGLCPRDPAAGVDAGGAHGIRRNPGSQSPALWALWGLLTVRYRRLRFALTVPSNLGTMKSS